MRFLLPMGTVISQLKGAELIHAHHFTVSICSSIITLSYKISTLGSSWSFEESQEMPEMLDFENSSLEERYSTGGSTSPSIEGENKWNDGETEPSLVNWGSSYTSGLR